MRKIFHITFLLNLLFTSLEAQNYKWSFNNGTFVNDLGTGFDGTTTTPTFTGFISDEWSNTNHAVHNTATAFGGVDIGDIPYLNGAGDFTMTFWFKFYTPANPNSNRALIDKGSNLRISLGTDNKMHCIVGGVDHWNQQLVAVQNQGFHFIALTRSGNTITLKYANKFNVGYALPVNMFSVTNSNPTTTAGSILRFLPSCDGIIDDVFLTNTALTNEQIDSVCHRFNPVNPIKETFITFNDQTASNTLGSNYNGTIAPEVKFTSDRFGNPCQAVTFDGSPQHVSVPQNITNSDQYTISGWFKKVPLGRLFINGSTVTGGYESLFFDAVGDKLYGQTVSYSTYTNSNNCVSQGCSNAVFASINNGEWFHVAYVRTFWDLKIYINGQYFSSVTSGLSNPMPTNMTFLLGTGAGSSFAAAGTSYDDLNIVNRALSVTQIDSLRNLPNPGSVGICPVISPKWIQYSFNNQNFNNDLGANNPGQSMCGNQFSTDRFGNPNMASPACAIWCGNVTMFNYAKKLSILGWFKKQSTTWETYLFTQEGVTGFLGVYKTDNDELIAKSGNQVTTLTAGNTAFTAIPNDQWFHLAYILDTLPNGIGNLKLYLNGVLYAENNNITSYISNLPFVGGSTYAGEFRLGAYNISSDYNYPLDDINLTNQALTITQIDSIRNLQNPITSVESFKLNKNIEIYPNPVIDFLNIQSAELFDEYEIVDLSGKIQMKGKCEGRISVKNLITGVYIIRLKSSNMIHYQKIIKE